MSKGQVTFHPNLNKKQKKRKVTWQSDNNSFLLRLNSSLL